VISCITGEELKARVARASEIVHVCACGALLVDALTVLQAQVLWCGTVIHILAQSWIQDVSISLARSSGMHKCAAKDAIHGPTGCASEASLLAVVELCMLGS
jgi:hypothetical protein